MEKHSLLSFKKGRILMSKGAMVDAAIIPAPSSTKSARKQRVPERRQTKKGNQWFFGMKIHVGADVDSVTVTPANTANITELPKLQREED